MLVCSGVSAHFPMATPTLPERAPVSHPKPARLSHFTSFFPRSEENTHAGESDPADSSNESKIQGSGKMEKAQVHRTCLRHTKRSIPLHFLCLLLSSTGCITHNYQGLAHSEEVDRYHPLSTTKRNRVYIFALSNLNPLYVSQVSQWKEQWQAAGFTKVTTGQVPFHLGWMKHLMREIHSEDADAVFVVVTHASARDSAERWVQECRNEGLPIAHVILMGSYESLPANCKNDNDNLNIHNDTLIMENTAQGQAELIALFHVLAQERKTHFMRPSSSSWHYPFAPPSRPAGDPRRYPQWSYLFDDRLFGDSQSTASESPPDGAPAVSDRPPGPIPHQSPPYQRSIHSFVK